MSSTLAEMQQLHLYLNELRSGTLLSVVHLDLTALRDENSFCLQKKNQSGFKNTHVVGLIE